MNKSDSKNGSVRLLRPKASRPQPTARSVKKRKKLFLIVLAITVFAIGVGVLGGSCIYMNNRPEKVLADAFTNTVSDITEDTPVAALGAIEFKNEVDEQPFALKLAFDAKKVSKDSQTNADITFTYGGKTYRLKTSVLTFGDSEMYVKVDDLAKTLDSLVSSVPDFSAVRRSFTPLIQKVDGQWIKITKADVARFGRSDQKSIDPCSTALENLQFSKADRKQLNKLFGQNRFIFSSEVLQSEKVGGEASFHYKLDLNNQAAENFAKQVINLQSIAGIKKECKLDDQEVTDKFNDISKQNNKSDATKPIFELWVGKKTRRPTKVQISAHNKVMTFDFTSQTKFDAPNVTIEKPGKSISIDEFQAEIQSATRSVVQP